ncbi:MAG: transglutaminase-like domain-containing protein [Treponema sp.]|nr:transglutaminase-like domain-containing protein [Treponema sp.]
MKIPPIILFILRLFFYLSVLLLIFVHPGISVSFDHIGILQWFVIIPLMAIIAFLPVPVLTVRIKSFIALPLLFALSITATGFNPGAFQPFIAGLTGFILTLLLFHHNGSPFYTRLAKIAALEPFFMAWVCLRLLLLSRSGEDIAGQSESITQFILVWTAVVFLFHSVVIYLCIYPKSFLKVWKEGIAFLLAASVLLFVVLFVLPPDFVRNTVIENLVSEKIPQKIPESSLDHGLPQRGNGRRTLPRSGEGRAELRGLSEHDWPGRGGSGGGSSEQRQYTVMIVASDREPVYMGEFIRGKLDPVQGFIIDPQEPFNELAHQRLFVTWKNNDRELDLGRRRQEVFSLSTLPQKYLPWRPVLIDPVILSEDTGPLRYIHQIESNTHVGDPLRLVNVPSRSFSEREKSMLAPYLEITLEESDRREFTSYLNNALRSWRNNKNEIIQKDRYLMNIFYGDRRNVPESMQSVNEYLETIIALLVSFSEYQYNLNPHDEHSIAALKEFLFNSNEGDCVEFSNTLALLGRLAGIPSRVVTGYLAAEGLQTEAHNRGISALRARIPVLQSYSHDELFLVTNTHGHSWTQFYIPNFGWLDFEATSFSIPPLGMGDFNNWDVVIPILDQNRTFSGIRKFPWQAVGKVIAALAAFALVGAYLLRYGREIILYIGSLDRGKIKIRTRARSLYLFLLTRLAADGQPIKPASKTAHEYTELFVKQSAENTNENPHFKAFADIYSELRWREFKDQAELNERFSALRQECENIIRTTRRRGIHRCIVRIFSLRGLAYL